MYHFSKSNYATWTIFQKFIPLARCANKIESVCLLYRGICAGFPHTHYRGTRNVGKHLLRYYTHTLTNRMEIPSASHSQFSRLSIELWTFTFSCQAANLTVVHNASVFFFEWKIQVSARPNSENPCVHTEQSTKWNAIKPMLLHSQSSRVSFVVTVEARTPQYYKKQQKKLQANE